MKAHTACSCPQIVFYAEILNIFKFHNTCAKQILQISGTLYSSQIVILPWHDGNTSEAASILAGENYKGCKIIVLQVLLMLLLIIKQCHVVSLYLSA